MLLFNAQLFLHVRDEIVQHYQNVQKELMDFPWRCAFLQSLGMQASKDVQTPYIILEAFRRGQDFFLQVDVIFGACEQIIANKQVRVLLRIVGVQALVEAMIELVLQLLVLLAICDVLGNFAEEGDGAVEHHLPLQCEATSEVLPPHFLADPVPPLCQHLLIQNLINPNNQAPTPPPQQPHEK